MYLKNESYNKSSGFTLIELAIYIIIFGIMLSMYVNLNRVWQESKLHYAAENNLENAYQAVQNFYFTKFRYPCPANPALVEGDPGFGEEDCSLAVKAGENPFITPSPGVLVGNIPTIVFDTADGVWDGIPDTKIPLRDFLQTTKIESTSISDPWNGSFRYAVTQPQTNSNSFESEKGAIRIIDDVLIAGAPRNTGGTDGNAHFVVFSHGSDNRCVSRGTYEDENCDDDSTFAAGLLKLNEASSDYYDDYVLFKRSYDSGVWANIPSESHIFPLKIIPDTAPGDFNGKVHIGSSGYEASPTIADIKLDVDGTVLVENSVETKLICNSDASKCLNPNTFYDDFSCPDPKQYLTAIDLDSSGRIVKTCEDVQFVTSVDCDPGTYLRILYTDNSPFPSKTGCQSP